MTLKVADLNFGCATFCALPSFDAVTTFSVKVSVKGNDIDMCSAIYFLFDHNTKYCTIYLCPHTVLATVWLSPGDNHIRFRLVLSPYSYRIYGPVKTNPNGQNSARET